MESSWTRTQTHVPYIGRQILIHCTTREEPVKLFHVFIWCIYLFSPLGTQHWHGPWTPVWMAGILGKEMATCSNLLIWRIPKHRGAWWAIVRGAAKSRTWLSEFKQQPSLRGAHRVHMYTHPQLKSSQLTLGCRALVTPVKSEERGHGFLVVFTPHLFCHPSTGCILGVGLVLSLMSHSGQTESRVHVAASLRKLSAYLDASGSQSRTFQEVGDLGSTSLPSAGFCFPPAAYFLLPLCWWLWY